MERIFSQQELDAVARTVLEASKSKTIAFYGAMGAGKTTLIKALLRELGAKDQGSSPTFGIVNEYHDRHGKLLAYHFDFYRLKDAYEALDIGLEEYLAQDAWIFMEWPEKIEDLLPDDCLPIQLQVVDDQRRLLRI